MFLFEEPSGRIERTISGEKTVVVAELDAVRFTMVGLGTKNSRNKETQSDSVFILVTGLEFKLHLTEDGA